jgi:acylpyruvate hydrolase
VRLVSAIVDGTPRAGRVEGDQVWLLDAPDVGALLSSGPDWEQRSLGDSGRVVLLEGLHLAPVVPNPAKIFCSGVNYKAHALEANLARSKYPLLFAKFARALLGPYDDLVLPSVARQVDWEVELGVIVGREVYRADRAAATTAIAGYTVVNDISMRDWQARTSEYFQGKTFQRSTPLGPVLVTPGEVDNARDLEVKCEVSGEVMQLSRTSDMIFDAADLIAYISQIITLDPGDVISMGTPNGVGAFRTPPRFLRDGDVVHTSIEGIGTLVNRCVAELPADV